MSSDELIQVAVTSTAKLGDDAWSSRRPEGYDFSFEEPLQKSDPGLGFLTVPQVTVVVGLVQSGFSDWLVGKQADLFWGWLKAAFGKITSPLGRRGTLRVTVPSDKGEGVTIEIERLDAAGIDSVRATLHEKVSGLERETKHEIYVKMKP